MKKELYPEGIKILLVERMIECHTCGVELTKGNIIYQDNYRGDKFCVNCMEEHEQLIIEEEGIDGRLLK